jgi:hypothetical protein
MYVPSLTASSLDTSLPSLSEPQNPPHVSLTCPRAPLPPQSSLNPAPAHPVPHSKPQPHSPPDRPPETPAPPPTVPREPGPGVPASAAADPRLPSLAAASSTVPVPRAGSCDSRPAERWSGTGGLGLEADGSADTGCACRRLRAFGSSWLGTGCAGACRVVVCAGGSLRVGGRRVGRRGAGFVAGGRGAV